MRKDQISMVIQKLDAIEVRIAASVHAINEALVSQTELSDMLLACVKTPVKPSSNAAMHLREHRPGRPSKIESDPELGAFILARIDTTSFPALERAIAEHFQPERRVGKSAIHQWWQRQRKPIPNSHLE